MKKKSAQKDIEPTELLRVAADKNRYQTIGLLMKSRSGLLVGEIAEALSMSQSATSHLLGVLHDARLVAYKKDGRESRYRLSATKEARRVVKIVRTA